MAPLLTASARVRHRRRRSPTASSSPHLVRNPGQALDRLLIREHRVLTRVDEAIWTSSDASDASDASDTASELGVTVTKAPPDAGLSRWLQLPRPGHGKARACGGG